MNKPIKQHDLPATYLRRFAIDPESVSHKRVVWCYRQIHNKHLIEKKSIHATLFKTIDFYTVPDPEHPYVVEELFSKEIEPRYETIMTEIHNETNLSFKCRQDLMIWLHFNKLRSRNKRAHLQKMINTSMMVDFVQKFGLREFNENRNAVSSVAEQKAKEIHINDLANQDLLTQLDRTFGVKHWLILKSRPEMPFITNDNPGFSINMNVDGPDFNTLSTSYGTNGDATNYFVLSPKYCLIISPFEHGTPLDVSIHNQEIKFLKSRIPHNEFINFCTIQTHSKYIVSNNKQSLEKIRDFLGRKYKD